MQHNKWGVMGCDGDVYLCCYEITCGVKNNICLNDRLYQYIFNNNNLISKPNTKT